MQADTSLNFVKMDKKPESFVMAYFKEENLMCSGTFGAALNMMHAFEDLARRVMEEIEKGNIPDKQTFFNMCTAYQNMSTAFNDASCTICSLLSATALLIGRTHDTNEKPPFPQPSSN